MQHQNGQIFYGEFAPNYELRIILLARWHFPVGSKSNRKTQNRFDVCHNNRCHLSSKRTYREKKSTEIKTAGKVYEMVLHAASYCRIMKA